MVTWLKSLLMLVILSMFIALIRQGIRGLAMFNVPVSVLFLRVPGYIFKYVGYEMGTLPRAY